MGQTTNNEERFVQTFAQSVWLVQRRAHHVYPLLLAIGALTMGTGCDTTPVVKPAWNDTHDMMASPRAHHASVTLEDQRILITGGETAKGIVTALVEVFDPAQQVFQIIGHMSSPRANHRITLLPDGRVLVTGGRKSILKLSEFNDDKRSCTDANSPDECTDVTLDEAQLFDPDVERVKDCFWKDAWSEPVKMASAHSGHSITIVENTPSGARGILFGGTDGPVIAEQFEYKVGECEPSDGLTFKAIDTKNIESRDEHTATMIGPNQMLIAGGENKSGPVDTMILAEITLEETTMLVAMKETSRLPIGRTGHVAISLDDEQALIAGGRDGNDLVLQDSWIIDKDGNIKEGPTLDVPRAFAATTLLGPTIVMMGGVDDEGLANSGRRFDASTQSWTTMAPLNTPRQFHSLTAAKRQTGSSFVSATQWLLAAGGVDKRGRISRSAELFYENGRCQVQSDCSAGYRCSVSQWCVAQ